MGRAEGMVVKKRKEKGLEQDYDGDSGKDALEKHAEARHDSVKGEVEPCSVPEREEHDEERSPGLLVWVGRPG